MPAFFPVDVYWLYLPKDVKLKYHGKFKAIGFLHIILGTICIVIESGAIVFFMNRYDNHYPSIASGIWAGLFAKNVLFLGTEHVFLLAGVFSIVSGATGKYIYVLISGVLAALSIIGSVTVISCNSYFAQKLIVERTKPITVAIDDEDTKLIPPLLILIAASFFELIVSLFHCAISAAVVELCFCCVRQRARKATDIRLNYPKTVVSSISSAVTRADSFQYQGSYDTVSTQAYPTYTRRAFQV